MYELIADQNLVFVKLWFRLKVRAVYPSFKWSENFTSSFTGQEELPPLNDHGATVSASRESSHSGSKCKFSLLVGARNVPYVHE